MSLDPILSAAPVIQIHASAALLALLLGPVALYRRRRDRLHKITGYLWVLAMAVTALSSFGIWSFALIGPFSPIHLLAVLALWSLWQGMRQILAGRVAAHAQTMRSLYWRGLIIAGLFNFMPGRVVNRTLFAQGGWQGWIVIAPGLALILWDGLRRRRMQRIGKSGKECRTTRQRDAFFA
jgi:uncharacterized membrane protein